MEVTDCISKVESMDLFQRALVYMDYFTVNASMKSDFIIVDRTRPNWNHGYGSDYKSFKGIAFSFLWKDLRIWSFEEFISKDRLVTYDHGCDWESRGWAQRYDVRLTGIYDWFLKFHDKLK